MRKCYLLATLTVAGLVLVISLPSPAGEAPSKEKIDTLIEQMGSGTFREREKASKELAAIGVPALEALRRAARSDDAEVRKRAEELIPKIETQAESLRVLAPKRVHLVYKDTPLREAVADFQKKSGYTIQLHDPDEKLKDRNITLDTGETAFWHALELFCEKASLTEADERDVLQPPRPPVGIAPGVAPAVAPPPAKQPAPAVKPAPVPAAPAVRNPAVMRPGRFVRPVVPGNSAQIVLKDGKSKKLPADNRSAVRVRALRKSDLFGNAPEGEVIVALEVSPEPRLQWQAFKSLRIEKAVDDQDQNLGQVIPQVEGGVGGFGGLAAPAPWAVAQPVFLWGQLHQRVPVQLKKGAKAAKSLKELKGVLTAHLLTEARPMIVADKLDKAAGKVFKGEAGGSLKIVEVKAEETQTTLRLEFEPPPYDKVVPAQANGMPGAGVPIGVVRPGVRIMPAPVLPAPAPVPPPPPPPAPPGGFAAPANPAPPVAQVQIQIGGGGGIAFGGPVQFGSLNGLSVQDAKGNTLPIRNQQAHFRQVQQLNGATTLIVSYTFVCQHDKDKGPARVVYLGRKRATVEIPFALKDVPLP